MEFTSLLNTALDLSIKPLRFLDEGPTLKQEGVESDSSAVVGRHEAIDEEKDALVEKLKRVSEENKKLTELITVMCQSYAELRRQLTGNGSKNLDAAEDGNIITAAAPSRKRKAEEGLNIVNSSDHNHMGRVESSSSEDEESSKKPKEEHIKSKISRLYFKTEPSDTSLIVKDGYQWRKYGQKVTRDNPCPRAYFKCALAPWCPVKKKVQRSVEDQTIVVATYEGEHNHPQSSSKPETATTTNSRIGGHGSSSSSRQITLDLTRPKLLQPPQEERDVVRSSKSHHQHLVEKMASILTRDPNFKSVLASAISGKFLQQNHQPQ